MALVEEVDTARSETARYRQAIAELKPVLEVLDHPT